MYVISPILPRNILPYSLPNSPNPFWLPNLCPTFTPPDTLIKGSTSLLQCSVPSLNWFCTWKDFILSHLNILFSNYCGWIPDIFSLVSSCQYVQSILSAKNFLSLGGKANSADGSQSLVHLSSCSVKELPLIDCKGLYQSYLNAWILLNIF